MSGYVFGVVHLSDSARAMESTKRQRREEASPASRVHGSGLPLLTSVSVVCRDATPQLQPLPHICAAVNAFLDVTPSRTIQFACSSGLMHLLQRIIAGYEHHPDTSVERDPLFRQIQFTRGMTAACKAGQLTIVEWLAQLPYFGACFMPYQAVRYAMTRGRLDVLKWLHANRTDICWRRNLVVVNGKRLDVAKWLQPMAGRYQNFGRQWIIPAAEAGNVEMVKWAYNLKGRTPARTRKAVQMAAENGHLHVVLWLLEQTGSNAPKDTNVSGLLKEGGMETLEMLLKYRTKISEETWVPGEINAISHGHQDVVERLFGMGYEFWGTRRHVMRNAVLSAASGGHLGMLKWLAAHDAPLFQDRLMDAVAGDGNVEILQWLGEEGATDCTYVGVAEAAKNGHLDVLRWLHEHNSRGLTFRAMDNTAANNHREVVEWLHVNRREGCTTAAMDGAAKSGHLEMVKWLHSNRSEGCTTAAMDQAARNGDFVMVKWLHSNRSEGCSTAAMDKAARNGDLEMVKWFHANRSEGCTTEAMDQAATYGHLDIVKFLNYNRSEGCTTGAMDGAAGNGHLKVVKWLHFNRIEGFTEKAMMWVTRHGKWRIGHRHAMEWLLDNGAEKFVDDDNSYNGNFEVALILTEERSFLLVQGFLQRL